MLLHLLSTKAVYPSVHIHPDEQTITGLQTNKDQWHTVVVKLDRLLGAV